MQLEKKYLEVFLNILSGSTELSLKEARVRDSVLDELVPKTELFIKDRETIYKKFCVKKEDGSPDIKDNKYTFNPEEIEELTKELELLVEEKVDFSTKPELKSILENTKYKPEIGETKIIDEIISKL